MHQATILSL